MRVSFRRAGTSALTVAVVLTAGLAGLAGSTAQAATDRPNTLAGARGTTPIANGAWVRERIATATDEDWYRFDVPKATLVTATLGTLPANYSLSIYDSAGRHVRTSNHPGVTFERVLWTAPAAGTYYARVDSAGGSNASRSYALRFRMLKKGVVVLSQHAFVMSNGHVSTMAELKNNTNGWRRIQSVYIEMVDANGRRLMTDLSTLSNMVMPPGGFTNINTASVVPAPAGFARVNVKPVWVDATPDPVNPKLTVRATGSGRTPAGQPTHQGVVTNHGPGAVEDTSVDIVYYDTYGNIRLVEGTGTGPIPAGGSASFDRTMQWAQYFAPSPNRVALMPYIWRSGVPGDTP
jgi:hypothetical protein